MIESSSCALNSAFQTLSERKRKWQLERQRCDEELEEVRRAGQQELDNLRSQLRKARTSTNQAAAEQVNVFAHDDKNKSMLNSWQLSLPVPNSNWVFKAVYTQHVFLS